MGAHAYYKKFYVKRNTNYIKYNKVLYCKLTYCVVLYNVYRYYFCLVYL